MVFYISIIVFLIVGLISSIFPDLLALLANNLLGFIILKFEWLYLITKSGILIFCIYLASSKYGRIRLGANNEHPEFSTLSWFAMLFSAGAGLTMVFWSVAEPMYHYLNPPFGNAETPEAARIAILFTFFHWGFNPWALYTIAALSIAYFSFRKGYKGLLSETFRPLFGDKIQGPLGQSIDVFSVIVTAFAVTTALGLGILQINEGLAHIFNIPNNMWVQLSITIVVTIIYIVSAVTGLHRGIKKLSNINLGIAFIILLAVSFLGPTSYIFEAFNNGIKDYARNFLTLNLLHTHTDGEWLQNWTLVSWIAWIAWAPFVGMFIARVSKGRTIRELIIAVLIIPSFITFVWFSVFGATALKLSSIHSLSLAQAVQRDVTCALFVTLEHLPLHVILIPLTFILLVTFFVTSADSATFVLGMFSSRGALNPCKRIKIAWGVIQTLVTFTILVRGGLMGLRTASIISALPFALIIVLMCFSIFRALQQEKI